MASSTLTQPYIAREMIEYETRQVLQRVGMYALPVDPLALARREGITVLTVKFVDETLAGSITKDLTGTTIRLNRDDPPSRKRFTLAHELGHHYLHLQRGDESQFADGVNNLYRQPNKSRGVMSDEARREYQANLFAAALLMPEEMVRSYWQSVDSIWEMARLFEVSDLAMSIRLGQLGLLDVEPV
jgi:Zn-dependent peptidase ImmA (M78 family)